MTTLEQALRNESEQPNVGTLDWSIDINDLVTITLESDDYQPIQTFAVHGDRLLPCDANGQPIQYYTWAIHKESGLPMEHSVPLPPPLAQTADLILHPDLNLEGWYTITHAPTGSLLITLPDYPLALHALDTLASQGDFGDVTIENFARKRRAVQYLKALTELLRPDTDEYNYLPDEFAAIGLKAVALLRKIDPRLSRAEWLDMLLSQDFEQLLNSGEEEDDLVHTFMGTDPTPHHSLN